MAAEVVDTRVVEAKFDSKQFEQGVDKTVKKLDELKKSLNLKDSEKSVADIGQKISETSEKASNSLEQLEKRFTSFFGMLKQRMISGVIDEIVGSLFKMKNAVLGFVQTLSTGQIGYGMQRYTDILTSVRTLTAAGVNEGTAYSTIERLGEYADQTSYSLDQLVDTMSKFKTAGADITTAQRMVEGLSNAAASMGVNAQDATRAYLNMQQAYSKGRMTQADWISFESLPMVGEKFNEAILKAAVKVGTLKETKPGSGTYQIDSKGIKAGGNVSGVKMSGAAAKGITAQNMGTKLASGWFDKRVMEEVFGSTYYFAEVGIDEVNKIKAQERKFRDDLRKSGVKEADLDAKTTERLQEYFDEMNKTKIETKKAEIEERKVTAKAELEAKKGNQKEYAEAKKEYDKLIKDLDKEMKDFEANNHLSAFAYQAFAAGQEARSFNDVLNTLKDTISRGWATSFELIFGKLDEAKDFFTSLTESQFAEGIYRIGEFRNLVLEGWRNTGGRDNMLTVLGQIDDLFGAIYKKMGLIEDEDAKGVFDQDEYDRLLEQDPTGFAAKQYKDWAENTDPFTKAAKDLGDRLSVLTLRVSIFFEQVKKWFTEADSTGTSRLQRISHILEGFGKVGTGVLTAVGQGLKFIGNVYTRLRTTFDSLWKALDELSQKFFNLFDPDYKEGINLFQVLADTLENILTVIDSTGLPKFLTDLVSILSDVAGFFIDMGIGTFTANVQFFTDAFALLLEVLGIGSAQQKRGAGVLDGIVAGIRELGNTCKEAFSAVSEFVNSAFADLKKALGLDGSTSGQNQNIFQNIQNWFDTNEFVQNVKTKVNKALIDIGDFVKDLPNRIVDLGVNIGDFFKGIFYYKTSVANSGVTWIKKPLTKWLENAANTVWNFVTVDIPKFVKGIPDIVSNFFNSLFYTKQTAKKSANGFYTYTDTRTPLKKWLDQAILDAKNFIKSIPEKLKKIPSLIEEFFKSIFYYKTSVANSGVTWVKKPFTQWVDENIVKNLKTFITELPTYIGQAIGTVSNFAGQVVSAIFGKEDGSPVTADDVTEGLRKPFLGANVTGIINSIKGVAKRILNGIASAFTGETDWESNKNWLAEGAAKLLENIKTKADEAWNGVSEFFKDLPNKIKNFFAGPDANASTEPSGGIGSAILDFAKRIGERISEIPDILLNAWKSAEALSAGLWDMIVKWIAGGSKAGELTGKYKDIYDDFLKSPESKNPLAQKDVQDHLFKAQWREDNPVAANIEDFIKNLVQYLGDKITHIPEDIVALWGNACTIVKAISDVLTDKVDGTLQDEDPVYSIATNVFTSIKDWFVTNKDKLVGIIKSGWDKAVTIGSIIGEVLFGDEKPVFDPKRYDELLGPKGLGRAAAEAYKQGTKDYGVYNGIANFFENIKDWVIKQARELPKNISTAWKTTVKFAEEVGPTILEGLKSAIDWVGDRFGDAKTWLEEFNKNPKTGEQMSFIEFLDNKFTDPTTGEISPLWEKIKEVGRTIRDLLIKTIPGFISEAVQTIATNVPNILAGIFGGNTTQDKKVDKQIDKRMEMQRKKLESHEKEYSKDAKEASRFFDEVNDGYIPKEGATNLWEAVLATGESLFGISGALAEEAEQTGNADGQKTKGIFEKLKDLWSGITGFFSDISKNSTIKTVGIVTVVLLVLVELGKIIDGLSAIDDLGYTFKWIGIGMLMTGITTILGYMTILASNAEEGTAEAKKLERVKDVFRDFKQLLIDIMEPLKWIFGFLAAKELFGMIKSFSSNEKTLNYQTNGVAQRLLSVITEPISALFKGFTSVTGKVAAITVTAEGIGTAGENISGNINDILGNLGSGIESFVEYLPDSIQKLKGIKDDLEDAILVVPRVKDLLELMIGLLTIEEEIPVEMQSRGESSDVVHTWEGPMANFVEGEEYIGEVVTKTEKKTTKVLPKINDLVKVFNDLSGSLSLFKNAVTGYKDDANGVADALQKLIGSKSTMEEFADFAGSDKWDAFKKALMSFGAIFRLYQDSVSETFSETPKEVNIQNLIDFLDQLFGNDNFKGLIEKFASEGLPDLNEKALDNSEKIVIFAAALSSIAKACSELSDDGSEASNINKLIETMSKIDFKNEDNVDKVVKNFGSLGNALGSFAMNTANLSEGNLNLADKALEMLLHIAIGLNQLPPDSFFSRLLFGDQSIDTFGIRIKELGENLKHFFDSINGIGENGEINSYSEKQLNAALRSADVLSRIAVRFSGTNLQTFKQFSETSFTKFGKSLTDFFNLVTGKDKDNKVSIYSDDDFSYLDRILDLISRVSIIISRIDQLEMKNLGDLNDDKVNKFYSYVNKIAFGFFELGTQLKANENALGWISQFKGDLNNYMDLMNSVTKIFNNLTKSSLNNIRFDPSWATEWFTNLTNGFFGYNDTPLSEYLSFEEDPKEIHHNGLFENIIEYFKGLSELETEITDTPKALQLFNDITTVMSAFSEAIASMYDTITIQSLYGGYAYDAQGYINDLSAVMQAIMDNSSIFTEFFNYGGQFNHNYLSNTLLMVSSLNELTQMLTLFDQSSFSGVIDKIKEFDWGALFEVIEERITYDNRDFFNPEIRPVLVVSDDFKAKAEELRKTLGFTLDDKGMWMSPDYKVSISGIDLPQLTSIDEKLSNLSDIKDTVGHLETIAGQFNTSLSQLQFNIDGATLVNKIGPIMNNWLGETGTIVVRGNFNQGSNPP